MINSIAHLTMSTVSLILMCAFGVLGDAEVEMYRDVMVVQADVYPFTFGQIIYMGDKVAPTSYVQQHEYGHILQERLLGVWYIPIVMLPSLVNYHGLRRSLGIETWATVLGGS